MDTEIASALALLGKKKINMQIAADCHEYMGNLYAVRSRVVNYTSAALLAGNFVVSVIGGCDSHVNIPLVITTALTMMVNATQQYCNFSEKATSHQLCRTTALGLMEDIEFVLVKSNHTPTGIHHELDLCEERIKSFRRNEEVLPLYVRHQFLPTSIKVVPL